MRARRLSRSLRVERLESRQVLAAGAVLDEGVLTIVGTNKNDRIAVSLVADQLLVALNGKKHSFAAGDVTHLFIDAGAGDDRVEVADVVAIDAWISGGRGHDKLKGGGGNDVISGGAGHDVLNGGWGHDVLYGEAGDDKLQGGDGEDVLHGGQGHDHLAGHAGNDELHGEGGHDKLLGGDGDDFLSGGEGKDTLKGEAGNDSLHGDGGHDVLSGGWGDDEVFGDAGHDELFGDAGNDWLDGGDGNDSAQGGEGDDKLKGGAGNDVLNGGKGENLLDGDEGKNKLKNGTEVDFEAPDEEFHPLIAGLTGQGSSYGEAVYERQETEGGMETFLHIIVHAAAPGQTLDVLINGLLIGHVEIGDGGFGELRLSSLVNPEGGHSLPDGFTLAPGDTITVGSDLTGQFVLA